MNRTRIVLVDDHPIVCQGLKALLEPKSEWAVVGVAYNGQQALRLVEQHRPHVLITDLAMPGLSGLEVCRRLRRSAPATRLIVLSMHAEETCVQQALECGVMAFVTKADPAEEVIRAIEEILADRKYLSQSLSRLGFDSRWFLSPPRLSDPYQKLTPREREVLQLVAEGNTSAQIAHRLFTSPRTIEAHRAHVMHKLGLRTKTDLIRYAFKRGMLRIDP